MARHPVSDYYGQSYPPALWAGGPVVPGPAGPVFDVPLGPGSHSSPPPPLALYGTTGYTLDRSGAGWVHVASTNDHSSMGAMIVAKASWPSTFLGHITDPTDPNDPGMGTLMLAAKPTGTPDGMKLVVATNRGENADNGFELDLTWGPPHGAIRGHMGWETVQLHHSDLGTAALDVLALRRRPGAGAMPVIEVYAGGVWSPMSGGPTNLDYGFNGENVDFGVAAKSGQGGYMTSPKVWNRALTDAEFATERAAMIAQLAAAT